MRAWIVVVVAVMVAGSCADPNQLGSCRVDIDGVAEWKACDVEVDDFCRDIEDDAIMTCDECRDLVEGKTDVPGVVGCD